MIKGSTVYYRNAYGSLVRARVVTVHRDGSVTVEPRFFQKEGRDLPGFIGGKVRLYADELLLTAA